MQVQKQISADEMKMEMSTKIKGKRWIQEISLFNDGSCIIIMKKKNVTFVGISW